MKRIVVAGSVRGMISKCLVCLTAALAVLAMNAGAAGVLSVTASGLGPLTFDLNTNPTNGFSTTSVGTSAATITNATQLDAAVELLAASAITTLLPQSQTQPPSINGLARYNYGGFFLQTRPTMVDYNVLLGTFRNDSGQDRTTITIDYDLAGIVSSDSTPNESPGIWGHRVYYSLT